MGKKSELYAKEKNKTSLFILIACIMFSVTLGVMTYSRVSEIVMQQNEESCIAYVDNVARKIDGDKFDRIGSEKDPEYIEIKNILDDSYLYKYIKSVYTVKLDNNVSVYVVDASKENPLSYNDRYDRWVNVGAVMSPGIVEAGIAPLRHIAYYTVYAPITDSKKATVGLLCMEIDAIHVDSYMNNLRNSLIFIIAVFTVVLFVIYMVISSEITERDMLTRLPNYEGLVRFGAIVEDKDEMDKYTAVIINIKNFKNINQKYGYEEGNRILVKMAGALTAGLKKNYFLARIGSDNFMVMLLNDDAEAFVDYLKEKNPISHGDVTTETLPASVRCGIYKASNVDTIERIISICTVSMNDNRNRGGDFSYYDDSVYEHIIKNGNILASFQRAIRNKEFRIFYQPKIDIKTNKLCGAEALIRWYIGDEYISPIHFIPLFESEGLITELDMYVLHTICEDINRWKKKGLEPVRIASNFSKIHLEDRNFAKSVIEEIDEMGVDYKYISIEMTESSGYANLEALSSFVDAMTEKGITVAMDDFGTGYSSLSLLGDIKMQDIKLDKSFVDKVYSGSEENSRLVENVIHMIKDLNRTVVCEGVEERDQLEFVRKAGCDIVQGYYFDKPLTENDFEARLRNPKYESFEEEQ